MVHHGRYPTPDEMEALIARARRLRSEYIGALITRTALRAKQFYVRAAERRRTPAPRYFPDVG